MNALLATELKAINPGRGKIKILEKPHFSMGKELKQEIIVKVIP
jgi:hypothetical protein